LLPKGRKNIGYHLVAFVTVAIWGSTFVFTKMLLLKQKIRLFLCPFDYFAYFCTIKPIKH